MATMPGSTSRGFLKPSGRVRSAANSAGKFANWRSGGGDDNFGAHVERVAGVVERIDRRLGVKMQVAPPIDPPAEVLEERCDVVNVELLVVERLAINRNLASESWPCPRMAQACVNSSCGRGVPMKGV